MSDTDLKKHIDECIDEVYDSLFNCIKKNEMIRESCEDDSELPEIFTEQMQMFCEYVSPDKDEITKWMDKKGYFYKGDKANKKKETMRMYQFLKQHKFDPKDETYESDIKEKNGKYKRLKLNIDPQITEQEKQILMDKSKTNHPDYASIKDKNDLNNSVKRGENAYFNRPTNSINIGAKELKGKQHYAQFTLKHEEGHADSWGKRAYGIPKNAMLPDDHPANIALKEHKQSGKYVNKHDDSSEELMADLYAVLNGRIRTKHWGKNKTVRKINKVDILRNFNQIEKQYNELSEKSVKEQTEKRPNKDDDLNQVKTYINNELDRYCKSGYKRIDLSSCVKSIIHNCSFEMCKLCSIEYRTVLSENKSSIDNDEIVKVKHAIEVTKGKIKKLGDLLQKINECYTSNGLTDVTEIKNYLREENNKDISISEEERMDNTILIIHIFRHTKTLTDIHNNLSKLVDNENSNLQYLNKEIEELNKKLQQSSPLAQLISDEADKFSNTHELTSDFRNAIFNHIKSIYEKTFSNANKQYDEFIKRQKELLQRLKKESKETNELRAKFAQTAIKEYFEELFDDDFYYD